MSLCFQFFWVHSRNQIPWWYGNPMFNFLRNCHIIIHYGCAILNYHQQWQGFQFFYITTNTCYLLLFFFFFLIAILFGVKYLLAFLTFKQKPKMTLKSFLVFLKHTILQAVIFHYILFYTYVFWNSGTTFLLLHYTQTRIAASR